MGICHMALSSIHGACSLTNLPHTFFYSMNFLCGYRTGCFDLSIQPFVQGILDLHPHITQTIVHCLQIDQGQAVLKELLALVDEDTAAFNRIMTAFGMPKATDEEKLAREKAIEDATLYATDVPLKTMRTAVKAFPLLKAMAMNGNPNSVSDAGVGALAARSAVLGALLNVRINAAGLKDRAAAEVLLDEADALAAEAIQAERDILLEVEKKIDNK